MADSGYVYLVTHSNAQGLHKIGLTRNPEQRTNQLGGDDCTVVAMVMCIDTERLENDLHKRFKRNRIPQSEWFNLSKEELSSVCEVLLKAHEAATKYVVLPQKESSKNPIPDPDSYQFLHWEEVSAKNLAGNRPVVYISGRGYCTRKYR